MKIYSKGGILLAKVNETPYSEAFMGERSISCTVKSPEPIQFLPGDYVDFRGERFVLDYTPTDKKTSSVGSIGDAFQYDLKFVSLKHELEKCLFLDVVLNDNDIHYTGLSDVQVFGDAKVLADRILANLNRLYTGEDQWHIEVLKETEAQNISLSDSNCWDAVALFKSLFNLNFTVYGREIKVGTAGKKIEHIFQYGSGDGLTEIVRTAVTGEAVVTRLKAYGGNRNLPHDYNKKGLVPESQYITNLMLPGYTETLIDYIDSDNISIYGVREAVFKDEEIYPSISGMTAEELKAAGVSTSATGRLDEIVYVEPIQREDQATFNVWIKDIGFDIKKQLTPTTALISMRDGNLGGYEFEITNVVIDSTHAGAKYKLTLNRNQDDNFILPDVKTYIKPGDHFVLLEIYMPEVYVKAAEQRLLKKAQEYLAEYDHVKATYSISMDKVFMANHPTIGDTIYAGDLIRIVDEDLKLDREIIIQNLTIKTGGTVPEYEVTLSDNPVATTLDRVQDNITDIEQNITANKVDGVKEARRRAIELQLLKSNIFDPDGEIKDTFLQTMMLQVGANSMNYQMGKTTARPRIVNMSFTNTSINLGADTVMHFAYGAGEEAASTWRIETPFSGSGLVEDKTYFVAIKASRDNLAAEWIVDENTYGVESVPGYYIFNFGILSAVTDGARLFSETRGNIYAYGDELSAGLISSIDRYCWFNLNTGDFQLYNKKTGAGLQFKDGVLTLGSFDPESGRFSSSISKIENEITQTSQQAADAQQAADEAARKAEDTQNYIDNTLREELDQLHDQADGLVERWDGDYIPSISNYPANQWTTEEEKQRHIDDTFTKNSGSEEYLGNSWKWSKVNGTWQWVLIADTALSAALLQSSEAKDIAKTKTRNFVATPYPPYEVGDLWTQGATGDMMRCATSRLSGSYVASDWTKASKYTDDAVAKEAIANLAAMSDDGVISSEEKATLRNDKGQIDKEFAKYQQDAIQYGVSISSLQSAYTTLVNFLTNTVKINENTNFTFASGQQNTYNQNFADYYAARTAFANEIANEISARKSLGQSWSSGKMLFTDPTFKNSLNSIRAYNNLGNGNVTLGLFPKVSDSPVASDFNIRITTIGVASPELGGFAFKNRSRANAVFVYRIIALIPKGYRIKFATNGIGTPNKTYWTTDTAGTGTWAEYIHVVECGQSGTFGTTGHFYLSALSSIVYPVDWYLAYASCFDLTEGSGPATDSMEAKKLAEEAKIASENAEFLNSVFGKDNTVINGGVVLSSILGVKNKRGVVVAGIINGELPQANNLMMFAGATSASAIGSAPFRVYADGSMYSSRGNIGGFTIGTSYIEKDGLRLSGGVISYSGSGYSMSFGGGTGGSLVYGINISYNLYSPHTCAYFQDNTGRLSICTGSRVIDAYGNINIGVNSNYIRMENGKMYIDGIPPYKNSGESDSFVYLAMHTGTHRIAFIP